MYGSPFRLKQKDEGKIDPCNHDEMKRQSQNIMCSEHNWEGQILSLEACPCYQIWHDGHVYQAREGALYTGQFFWQIEII